MAPKGFWEEEKTVDERNQIVDWLTKELSIKCVTDWYEWSLDRIWQVVPFSINLHTFLTNELGGVLKLRYPHHSWNMQKLLS